MASRGGRRRCCYRPAVLGLALSATMMASLSPVVLRPEPRESSLGRTPVRPEVSRRGAARTSSPRLGGRCPSPPGCPLRPLPGITALPLGDASSDAKQTWRRGGRLAARCIAAPAPIRHQGPFPKAGSLLSGRNEVGAPLWIEVRSVEELTDENEGRVVIHAAIRGQRVLITQANEPQLWDVKVQGWDVEPGEPWVEAYPELEAYADKMHQRISRRDSFELTDLYEVFTLEDFREKLRMDPSTWVSGEAPENVTPLDTALLNAGELIALRERQRGLVIVQLCTLWGINAEEPLHRPFVVTLLREIAQDKNLHIISSPAPEGLGLSALVCARQEPYLTRAYHLQSFGCQAAVVAESSYYKALVGTLLGYRRENIIQHIEANPNANEPPMSKERMEEIFRLVNEEVEEFSPHGVESSVSLPLSWDAEKNLPEPQFRARVAAIEAFVKGTRKGESSDETTNKSLESLERGGGKNRAKKAKKNKKKDSGGGGFGGGFGG